MVDCHYTPSFMLVEAPPHPDGGIEGMAAGG
jgi:hypothetical protein